MRPVLGTLVWLLVIVPAVHACSCASSAGCKFVLHSDAVFLGTVIAQETGDGHTPDGHVTSEVPQTTTFSIKESYVGAQAGEIAIDTGAGICSYHFEVGRTYLVFANRYKGKLSTTKCSPNQPEEEAAGSIEQLRNRSSGRRMASLFGEAYYLPNNGQWAEGQERFTPEAGVLVVAVDTNGARHTATTSDSGTYEFRELPPGNYVLQTENLPEHMTTRLLDESKPLQISIEVGESCQQDLSLSWDGRIQGKIVNRDGKPLTGFVWLQRRSDFTPGTCRVKNGGFGADTERDGSFEFRLLEPESYRLYFHPSRNGNVDFRSKYCFPEVISLGKGQHLSGLSFVVLADGFE